LTNRPKMVDALYDGFSALEEVEGMAETDQRMA
jgi:hypothetical protein